MTTPFDSQALTYQSTLYPKGYGGRVPRRVSTIKPVVQDFPFLSDHPARIAAGVEVDVIVNSHGAVTAILPGDVTLGLKPGEFEVIAWHDTPFLHWSKESTHVSQ